jgi:hypothetical protein
MDLPGLLFETRPSLDALRARLVSSHPLDVHAVVPHLRQRFEEGQEDVHALAALVPASDWRRFPPETQRELARMVVSGLPVQVPPPPEGLPILVQLDWTRAALLTHTSLLDSLEGTALGDGAVRDLPPERVLSSGLLERLLLARSTGMQRTALGYVRACVEGALLPPALAQAWLLNLADKAKPALATEALELLAQSWALSQPCPPLRDFLARGDEPASTVVHVCAHAAPWTTSGGPFSTSTSARAPIVKPCWHSDHPAARCDPPRAVRKPGCRCSRASWTGTSLGARPCSRGLSVLSSRVSTGRSCSTRCSRPGRSSPVVDGAPPVGGRAPLGCSGGGRARGRGAEGPRAPRRSPRRCGRGSRRASSRTPGPETPSACGGSSRSEPSRREASGRGGGGGASRTKPRPPPRPGAPPRPPPAGEVRPPEALPARHAPTALGCRSPYRAAGNPGAHVWRRSGVDPDTGRLAVASRAHGAPCGTRGIARAWRTCHHPPHESSHSRAAGPPRSRARGTRGAARSAAVTGFARAPPFNAHCVFTCNFRDSAPVHLERSKRHP